MMNDIICLIDKLTNLKVLVIGDSIIDHYVFVKPKGRAIKDPILSVEYNNEERYAGGVLAIANHIHSFVNSVTLITLIGEKMTQLDFIKKSLAKNIQLKTFVKKEAPTITKKRYVDEYRNNKLFKIEYMNDVPIKNELTQKILEFLNEEINQYDLVIVGDFGHGFINETIRRKLEEKSKFLALNVQSNSANMGYHYLNLYKRADFISMNEQELRLPFLKRFEPIEEVIQEMYEKLKFESFVVTLGKKGSLFVHKGEILKTPVQIKTIKDTVGAGDALFSLASLLVFLGADNKIIPFVANCAGAIAANTMGNKEPVTKEKLLNFIKEVYQNELGKI